MTELARGDFGEDFTWGVAHAAYQVEGAWDADGKGPSIWDTFTHGRGKIRDGSTGDVACDFYHRSAEDTALVRSLGFDAQRFSISWPRVLPEGTGRVNAKGLDFYDRVVDECLEAGVDPWVTLYHWDLPEALHRRGGWANRDIVGWFGEYVDVVAERLGDRVENWMVFNEPCSFLLIGYLAGAHAPGVRSLRKFLAATHHVNLCQSVGASALRARVADANVGTTHIITPPRTTQDRPKDRKARAAIDAFANRIFIENGAAFADKVEGDRVHDARRTAFYQSHLAEVRRARTDGMGVDGYFCWSLMDNFEWAEGYVPRFGLTHIDFATQQRTVKDSGLWFQQFLADAPG